MNRYHIAMNLVNQILEGAVESGAYELVDMKKRQEYNDVADAFVLKMLNYVPLESEEDQAYEEGPK